MADTFARIRGLRDVSDETAASFRAIMERFRVVAGSYGYDEIFLPLLEDVGLFERGLGLTSDVVSKEIYRFEDVGGQMVALRPEGTAGAVRAALQMAQLSLPKRLFYDGAMFRRDRPQKGRYRQFYQLGIELLGGMAVAGDHEVIALADDFLQGLNVRNRVVLQLNSLGDDETRTQWRAALVDYFTSHHDDLSPLSQERLQKNPLRILDSKEPSDRALVMNAPRIDDFFTKDAGAFFAHLQNRLDNDGIVYERVPHLVRGLDYYGHTAFEYVASDGLGAQNTVLAGGRYDGLAPLLGGRELAAVGWAAGVDRLALLCDEEVAFLPEVWLLPMGTAAVRKCYQLARAWRATSLCRVIVEERASLAKRLTKAHKQGVRCVAIMGEDELRADSVTWRDFKTGKQQTLSCSQVTDSLAALLGIGHD